MAKPTPAPSRSPSASRAPSRSPSRTPSPSSAPALDLANAPSLPTSLLGSLLIDPLQHPRGQPHLSAASGLVRQRGQLYVVADDELHLGIFSDPVISSPLEPTPGTTPSSTQPLSTPPLGTLLRLLDGDLPQSKSQRKKARPDFETLALLPALPGCPAGALLAMGSGSQPHRETGVLAALDGHGAPNGRMAVVKLGGLYAPLRRKFPDLNIEGAFVTSGELLLLQRGNRSDPRSACIRFDWNLIAPWLAGLQEHPPGAKSVQFIDLGHMGGIPLCLTDGAALHGGAWMFSAVTENTPNSVQYGPCVATAIGIVAANGQVSQLHALQGAPKVEGIAVKFEDDAWVVTMVTDANDPAAASQLLQARMPMAMASKLPEA